MNTLRRSVRPLAQWLCALAFGLLGATAWAAHTPTNAVHGHPSPYLKLHGSDPVHWSAWGKEPLARARAQNKLLFVSIGYFSCHWCHVMQRESYRNAAIAAQINEHFVAVKVDRELQPALDEYMMAFAQATLGHAGWPLNVFLTPDGYPLVAAIYLPPDQFANVLERLQGLWASDATRLRETAERAAKVMAEHRARAPDAALGAGDAQRLHDAFVQQASELADALAGGFGETQKFPSVPQLLALLEVQRRTPGNDLADFLGVTLAQMAAEGLRDHLAGGFFRYATDPQWQIPHFEKMLYDNALLAELYLRAARVLHAPHLADVGRETLDFVLAELAAGDDAFIASLSAVDAAGAEGGYYLWQADALAALLSPQELDAARLAWGFDAPPPFEHGHLPRQAASVADVAERVQRDVADVRADLARARDKLLRARATRSLPRDDKVLAGWNGLMLSALAHGAALADGERYAAAGRRLRDYLATTFWDGKRLSRARHASGSVGDASLEDYAYVARGLVDWARATDAARDWALARRIVEAAWPRFHRGGGWQLSEDLLIPYLGGETVLADGPMPSPSAVLLEATLALVARERATALGAQARSALTRGAAAMEESPFFYATQISLLQRHLTD